MFMKKRVITLMVSTLMLFVGAGVVNAGNDTITLAGAATIIVPAQGAAVDEARPTFAALAIEGRTIYVYIDGKYVGDAEQVSVANGVQSVKYTPTADLSYGVHTVSMVPSDPRVTMTVPTEGEYTTFWYEQAYPQPTLFTPVVNEDTTWQKPYVVGVAPSGSFVEVYIDGVYSGRANTSVDESGVGSFAYIPATKLSPGTHYVKALAARFRSDGSVRVSAETVTQAITITDPSVVVVEETTAVEEVVAPVVVVETEPVVETISEAPVVEVVTPEAVVDEEVASTEEVATVDEEATDEEEDNEEVASTDEEETSSARTTLGWILLVIAAAILVSRFRKKGNKDNDSSEKKETVVTEATKEPANQQQLELHAPKENKNIEVVKKDTSSEQNSSDKNDN